MPPSAVVDASVLVSAFLFPESIPGQVLKRALKARFQMHLSAILVEETRRSLLSARLGI
jgi:predicted nucleic acid-binding protein